MAASLWGAQGLVTVSGALACLLSGKSSSRDETVLFPSGSIHALRPNFRLRSSELSAKIEQKKIKKSRRVNHIRSAAATLRSAVGGGVN